MMNSEHSMEEAKNEPLTAFKNSNTFLIKGRWAITDWFWPSVMPMSPQQEHKVTLKKQKTREEIEKRADSTCRNFKELKAAKESLEKLLEQEGQRRQRVETRLISMAAFSAVAASVIVSISRGIIDDTWLTSSPIQKIVVGLLEFYSVLQLFSIVWHSFQGLQRRSYKTISPIDVLPAATENRVKQIRRYLSVLLDCMEDNDKQNCLKVNKMALVYTAARNCIVGVALLTLGLLSIQLIHSLQDDVAQELGYETIPHETIMLQNEKVEPDRNYKIPDIIEHLDTDNDVETSAEERQEDSLEVDVE